MDFGDEDVEEKMIEDLKVLEKQVAAKKDVLKEVLSVIINSEDEKKGEKRRRNIGQVLSAKLTHSQAKNTISAFSIELLKTERFVEFTCATILLQNHDKNFDIVPEVFTQPLSTFCKWLIFQNSTTIDVSPVIRKSSSNMLIVAFSNSLFFEAERISLAVSCKPVPPTSGNDKLDPCFCSLIAQNQQFNLPTPQILSIDVEASTHIPFIEVNSLEMMDEQAALNTTRYILTCFSRRKLKKSLEFSDFRQLFPKFCCCDFDSWQILIGTYQFSGIFTIFTSSSSSSSPKINQIYGKNSDTLLKFASIIEK